MRYFLHLSYNGAKYRGWQRQVNVVSVQEVLEQRLSALLKQSIALWGCGRTDAQVHASQFYAHFDVGSEVPADLLYKLNKILPADIVVFHILEMQAEAHAQFDAVERTYDYFFHTKPNAFVGDYSSYYDESGLNLKAMQEAARKLCAYTDYRAFCKTPDKHNHTLCEVKMASIESNADQTKFHFQITANRFLKGMIRIIMWHLLEIGRGNESMEEFENFFLTKQRPQILRMAYPQGLYLSKINYPYLNQTSNPAIFKALFS